MSLEDQGQNPLTRDEIALVVPLDSLVPSDGIFDARAREASVTPTCKSCKNPYYPENVARRGVQGTVLLSAVITADGRASNITIVKKLDRELDQEALNVVRTWKFIPGVNVDGKPVAVRTPIEVIIPILLMLIRYGVKTASRAASAVRSQSRARRDSRSASAARWSERVWRRDHSMARTM